MQMKLNKPNNQNKMINMHDLTPGQTYRLDDGDGQHTHWLYIGDGKNVCLDHLADGVSSLREFRSSMLVELIDCEITLRTQG